jgi:hypothetical protein
LRKGTKRKVWTLRNPPLPLTDGHHRDLALGLHVAVANIMDPQGCNAFTRQLMIATVAMDVSGKHDTHSRTLLRTACLMLEKACNLGKIDDKTVTYCKTVASWIDRWIGEGRITYDGLTQAKKLASKMIKDNT